MHGDGRVDQVAAKPSQSREGSVLVGSCQPRIANDVGDQGRRQLPGLTHRANRFGLSRRSLLGGEHKAISLIGCISMLH
jgi:hypothetical protein